MTMLDFEVDLESAERIMSVESEVHELNEKLALEIAAVHKKFEALRVPILQRRDAEAEKIPSFWSTALMNNSFLQSVALPNELALLTKLTKISLERSTTEENDFKLLFSFSKNDHFSNAVLVKEVTFDEDNNPTCIVADIKWAQGKRFFTPKKVAKSAKHSHNHAHSHEKTGFFGWLQDEDSCSHNLAMLISEEIYPNAGKFYAGEAEDDEEEFETGSDEEDEDELMDSVE